MAHPVHPAIVHFPIVCWSFATIGDVASLRFGAPAWNFSNVMLVLGIVTALAAMMAGLIDLKKIDEKSVAMRAVNRHMYLIGTAWTLYLLSLLIRMNGTTFIQPNSVAIGLSVIGFLLLCVGGWFGGELVYKHGIGVVAEAPDNPF